MPRTLPPPSGPAAPETIKEHLRIGRRWINRAKTAHPDLRTEDALALSLEGGDLDPSTIGRYRADLRYALIEHMTEAGRLPDFQSAWTKVDTALTKRKNFIPEENRRTSALKVEDPTEEEVRSLFRELKRHALKHGNPNAILAALFTLVAGHCGFRPIELRGAQLVGTRLTMPNAKKRPGHEKLRTMDLAGLHKDVLVGLGLMLDLIDDGLSKAEFASWEKVLAGQIRRACIRIGIRKLSLYSFRHVAIASWSAAGLPPEEIARLCGHLSIRTAHTHYARAAKGHKRKAVARAMPAAAHEPTLPLPLDVAPAGDRSMSEGPAPKSVAGEADPGFFEEMPVPVPRQDRSRVTVPGAEALRHFERVVDPRDPELIADNIARARAAREAGGAPEGPDEAEPTG
ncbi:hypothetical protein [Devosia sp. CAU 1758]